MKDSTKKVLVSSGIIAAGAAAIGAVSHAVTKKLVKIALDRETPKSDDKSKTRLTGTQTDSAFADQLLTAAEKLEQSDCEEVEIISHDGTKLVGHWRPCQNPKRIIVAMHGWRSSWARDFGTIADFWHDNGCSVLYAEQRGQGGSGGEYMGFGLLERYDCLDWIDWVNEQCGMKLPIYLGGVSMGATTVLMAAGLDLPENVCGIVADCGFTSPHAIWKHVAENNLHVPYGMYEDAANDLCRKKIQIGAKDYSAEDAMRECMIPVLFIHGSDDHFVPIEMTYQNYKACAAQKRLLVVPGAEHGMSYFVDRERYEAELRSFWSDCDNITCI